MKKSKNAKRKNFTSLLLKTYKEAPLGIVMAGIVFLIQTLFPSLSLDKDKEKEDNEGKFLSTVVEGLVRGTISSLKQLNIIADAHKISKENVSRVLKDLFSNAACFKFKDDEEKKIIFEYISSLEKLIDEIEKKAPFSDLPENIAMLFRDISEEIAEKNMKSYNKLRELASVIKTKEDSYYRVLRSKNKLEKVNIFLSVCSVILTVVAIYLGFIK